LSKDMNVENQHQSFKQILLQVMGTPEIQICNNFCPFPTLEKEFILLTAYYSEWTKEKSCPVHSTLYPSLENKQGLSLL